MVAVDWRKFLRFMSRELGGWHGRGFEDGALGGEFV